MPGPLDCWAVDSMMERLRGSQILKGARGQSGADAELLYQVMARLQVLLNDYPEISEIEINPLVFKGGRGMIVDARVVVK